jgi:glycerate kinase
MSLKVLIAPDNFKGTLSARAAADAMARGWRQARPADQVMLCPISDGGFSMARSLGWTFFDERGATIERWTGRMGLDPVDVRVGIECVMVGTHNLMAEQNVRRPAESNSTNRQSTTACPP